MSHRPTYSSILRTAIVVSVLAGMTAACGEDGDEIVFDAALGTATASQVKQLPNDLRGPEATNYRGVRTNPDLTGTQPRKLETENGDGGQASQR